MVLLLSKNEADCLAHQHRRTSGAMNCRACWHTTTALAV